MASIMPTIFGSELGELITGTIQSETIFVYGGNDIANAGDGNDYIDGGWGNDQLNGDNGDDTLLGGTGDDTLNGGNGSDTYVITGNCVSGFQGYDTYTDTGSWGSDRILAVGTGNVDIGFYNFRSNSGIEIIDGTGATGLVRLLGDWQANYLDFSAVQFLGTNIVIDGGGQCDTIIGTQGNDIIIGGSGDDWMNGGNGSDTYIITGNEAAGWPIFQGYDTYKDTGSWGIDRIVALGTGNVDIALSPAGFSAANGIEIIDGSRATGIVRVMSEYSASLLDFSTVQFIGGNIQIDGGRGSDTIIGTNGNDTIIGGGEADLLDGGQGSDTYLVTGNLDTNNWLSFQDHDTYRDTGTSGTDRIVAVGTGNVDVGLVNFSTASSGIEVIDGSGCSGTVRLIGNWLNNYFDFSATQFIGNNFEIHGDGMRDDGGNDTLIGSQGNDTIFGGGGYDLMDGSNGSDTYIIDGNLACGWNIFSGYDTYRDTGNSGIDRIVAVPLDKAKTELLLSYANIYTPVVNVNCVDIGIQNFTSNNGIEIIDGTRVAGTVTLLGNWDANLMDFSNVQFLGSNFVINGDSANDTIIGSQGNDIILGGDSSDVLTGGLGADQLSGGSGWNRFIFNSTAEIGKGLGTRDVITDFQPSQDCIDLTKIDANTLQSGDQAFTFIGSADFSGAGQLRFASGLVSGDVNGDGIADFELALTGVTSVNQGVFAL